MPLYIYVRKCPDCGEQDEENADEIQPGYCPRCARLRLERVMQTFLRHVGEYGLSLAREWLALALVEDGGLTKAWAELKADELVSTLGKT
jgi:hypothetical protein